MARRVYGEEVLNEYFVIPPDANARKELLEELRDAAFKTEKEVQRVLLSRAAAIQAYNDEMAKCKWRD